MDPRDLYGAIDALGGVALELRVYRQVSESRDCLSGEGARRFGGRWNPPNSFPALYASLELATAKAELDRLMRRQQRTLADLLPRRICEIHAALTVALDLQDAESLALVGITNETIKNDDLAPCQAVGQAAHQLGFEAILAPSATGSGTNLVVFELNLLPESRLEVARSYVWSIADEE